METATLVSLLTFAASYQELLNKVLAASDGGDNFKLNMQHDRVGNKLARKSPSMRSSSSQKWAMRRPRRALSAPALTQISMSTGEYGHLRWEGSLLLQVEGFSLVLFKCETAGARYHRSHLLTSFKLISRTDGFFLWAGIINGLLFELDLLFNVEFSSTLRTIMLDLTRFMISEVQAPSEGHGDQDNKVVRAPRFGSIHSTSSINDEHRRSLSGESTLDDLPVNVASETECIRMEYEQAFTASDKPATSDASSCILEQLKVSCLLQSSDVDTSTVEKEWSSAWRGSCSIAGLDLAITTQEIKVCELTAQFRVIQLTGEVFSSRVTH